MLPLVVDVLVDLVGERVRVVAAAQLGYPFELGARQHVAGRVVRRAQDDGARTLGERLRQPVEIERPPRLDRNEYRFGAAENRVGAVILVERLQHDHLVARIDQRQHGGRHRLSRAAGDGDLGLGIDRHAIPVRILLRQRIPQALRPPRHGVLIDVGADRLRGRLLQHLGAREVGKALRQVDGVVLGGEPRHAAT